MLNIYGNIFTFFLVGVVSIFIAMSLVKLIAPYRPGIEKNKTYECGEEPIGTGWINFNARFYLIAILFIIFDVEIVLILPVILQYKDYISKGLGLIAFFDIFLFVGILFLGLLYAWKNGYLEWVRSVRRQLRVDGKVIRIKEIKIEKIS